MNVNECIASVLITTTLIFVLHSTLYDLRELKLYIKDD